MKNEQYQGLLTWLYFIFLFYQVWFPTKMYCRINLTIIDWPKNKMNVCSYFWSKLWSCISLKKYFILMFIIKPTEIPSLSFLINSHFFLHPVFATADQQQHLSSRGQQEVLQQPAQVQLSPAEHLNSLLTSWIQHLRPAAFSEKLRQWSRFWQHNIVCFFYFYFFKEDSTTF